MNRLIVFIAALAIMLLVGCSDVVSDHYKTRADADADQLFERGWLPAIIPASAKDITTLNNLNLNTSEGEFSYYVGDTSDFAVHLKPYSGRKPKLTRWQGYVVDQTAKGHSIYEFSDSHSVWLFSTDAPRGHVSYIMWSLNTGL
jgi:hypothetical protein